MKEIFMVAGGPSLKGFHWNRLANKDVFAINRSYEVLPNAKYIYFADWDFFERHKAPLLEHSGQIITGYAKGICKKRIEHPSVCEYNLTGANGLDQVSPGIRHGRTHEFIFSVMIWDVLKDKHIGTMVIPESILNQYTTRCLDTIKRLPNPYRKRGLKYTI